MEFKKSVIFSFSRHADQLLSFNRNAIRLYEKLRIHNFKFKQLFASTRDISTNDLADESLAFSGDLCIDMFLLNK